MRHVFVSLCNHLLKVQQSVRWRDGQKLHERMNGHRADIKNKSNTPVGLHFNTKGHQLRQHRLETVAGLLDCREMSNHLLEGEWLGIQVKWFALHGVTWARKALTGSPEMDVSRFSFVPTVACMASCVLRCSQKVFSL